MSIDWPALRAAATAVAARAHAPYSGLQVGAAGLDGERHDGHRLQRGERLVRAHLVRRVRAGQRPARGRRRAAGRGERRGGRRRSADAVRPLPAAALEAGGPELLLDADGGPQRLGDLLPGAFTDSDLASRAPQTQSNAMPDAST